MSGTYLTAPLNLAQAIDKISSLLDEHQLYFGHGTDCAFDESAWLCLWCLKLPLDSNLDELRQRPLSPAEIAELNAVLRQRIALRRPTAYITRQAWLQGIPFYIDERSIIPRSLIAELIADGGFDAWLNENTTHVLDLCTGNGSLAIIAALTYPQTIVDAADLSPQALEVAQINITQHRLDDRIKLLQSDIFSNIKRKYDLILCNPPYVNSRSMEQLPPEYLAEPSLALAGGVNGMDFIAPFLQQAANFMTENAVLVLEIGNEYDNFIRLFNNLEVIWLPTRTTTNSVLLLSRTALLKYAFD